MIPVLVYYIASDTNDTSVSIASDTSDTSDASVSSERSAPSDNSALVTAVLLVIPVKTVLATRQ